VVEPNIVRAPIIKTEYFIRRGSDSHRSEMIRQGSRSLTKGITIKDKQEQENPKLPVEEQNREQDEELSDNTLDKVVGGAGVSNLGDDGLHWHWKRFNPIVDPGFYAVDDKHIDQTTKEFGHADIRGSGNRW